MLIVSEIAKYKTQKRAPVQQHNCDLIWGLKSVETTQETFSGCLLVMVSYTRFMVIILQLAVIIEF